MIKNDFVAMQRLNGARSMLKFLDAFPVAIIALNDNGQVITFGFTGQGREELKVMLSDALKDLDNADIIKT